MQCIFNLLLASTLSLKEKVIIFPCRIFNSHIGENLKAPSHTEFCQEPGLLTSAICIQWLWEPAEMCGANGMV